jgi:RNA-binding protein YlmH
VRQLTLLGTLMTKKVIPQQLGDVLNEFNATFLPVAQAESCRFEVMERQVAEIKS